MLYVTCMPHESISVMAESEESSSDESSDVYEATSPENSLPNAEQRHIQHAKQSTEVGDLQEE